MEGEILICYKCGKKLWPWQRIIPLFIVIPNSNEPNDIYYYHRRCFFKNISTKHAPDKIGGTDEPFEG